MSLAQVAESVSGLAQRAAPLHDRRHPSGLEKLLQDHQILFVRLRYEEDHFPARLRRAAQRAHSRRAGVRRVDQRNPALSGYDPVAAGGSLTADHRTFTVSVADNGSIIVNLGARAGKQPPVLNAVRVTHRPDL